MEKQISIAALKDEFRRFAAWESQSFENWEAIEIFIAGTLSEAWMMARPSDRHKFTDAEFKDRVDRANGKWLEKTNPDDSYKIILSTRYHDSLQALTRILIHEMRHCLDYQNAVKDLPFCEYTPGNAYYNNWSEFRAVYSQVRYEYFIRSRGVIRDLERFGILAEILGKHAADATTGLMRSEENLRDTLYFLSRYIGASRAVRNLNMETSVDAEVFHLWTMTPQYITEHFGYVFYIGNEWDDTKVCALDASPQTYYYNALVDRIEASLKDSSK